MPAINILPGLRDLAPAYDGFILDLWGVVHDGHKLYDGVVHCLEELHRHGKRVTMLSNAPRRAETVAEAMTEMGLDRALYDHVLSSGELAYRAIEARIDPWYAGLGRRCLHMGPDRDKGLFDGLGLEIVAEPDQAQFIVNTGPWQDGETVGDYELLLAACVRRNIAMVCANPDLEVIRGGRRIICAGALAARYAELGGEVRYHGKPFAEAYRACLALMGFDDPGRIIAIGDSLGTDIKGALDAGLDAVLVTGGIHAEELRIDHAEHPDPERLQAACVRGGHFPKAAIPAFIW